MPNPATTAEPAALAERIAATVAEGHQPDPELLAQYRALVSPPPVAAPTAKAGRRPLRNFRLDEDTWTDVVLLAELTDRNASDVIRDALAAYVPGQLEPHRPADAR